MLGNITVKREELKVRDFEKYRGFYCGVCHDLRTNCGELSRMTLTYDMTFLAILLTSLYEPPTSKELRYCMFHPGQKKLCYRNKYTSYAADMSVLIAYHNLMDDWRDEKSKKALVGSGLLHAAYKKTAPKYERQMKALLDYLEKLHQVEEAWSNDLDLAAGLTGEFFKEVFIYDENDIWSPGLGEMGFYLGKYIYLLDAYEDLQKDKKSGNYNPFFSYRARDDFDAFAKDVLTMMATNAAAAFERLPIVKNTEILRNVLYAGIWNKYYDKQKKKENR